MSVRSAPQLRTGALGLIEIIGQSLAAIAPTLTPAINITVVATLAGLGCWLAYFIGTLAVVLVAACVGILAARHPEAGAFFVYIGRTLGPFAGALAGWAMVSAYLFTAVAVTLSFVIFLGNFFTAFGRPLGVPGAAVVMVIFVGSVTFAAYRDVRLSSRAGLVLEVIALVIMLAITALIVRVQGTVVDPAQLDLASFHYGAIFSALPFVIFSFVGFESAATLAKESADPKKNIPLAVIGCSAFAGIFFTVTAYVMVFGMGGDTQTLGASTAPFGDVALKAGLGWASNIVYLAALVSEFACALACVNAASRLLYSMGKYRFLHNSMGLVHGTHRTPYRAVLVCGALVGAGSLSLLPAGLLDAFGLSGTLASFGFVVVYAMLCIAAPLDLRKSGEMRAGHVGLGVVGTASMLFVIAGSVYPAPAYPYNVLPYVFFAYLAVGAAWFAWLQAKSPHTSASIQFDMEV